MRITLAQIDSRPGQLEVNIMRAQQAVTEAVGKGADLVVFPELSLSGYSIGDLDEDASIPLNDSRLTKLVKEAKGAGLLLGFPEIDTRGLRTYNSQAYYENDLLVHVHRKLFLPKYATFDECKYFSPGQSSRAFAILGKQHRATILISDDATQPQFAYVAAQGRATLLIIPACSPQSMCPNEYDSRSYWHDITRFYGRMLQLYVVFVNRVGIEGSLQFWGGSHVVDPWGTVIAEAAECDEQLLTVDIDVSEVWSRRRTVPLEQQGQLSLMRREIDRLMESSDDR